MNTETRFSKPFAKRMRYLAFATAAVIALSIPLTSLLLLDSGRHEQVALIIFMTFFIVALLTGTLLYRLPVKEIVQAEAATANVIDNLIRLNRELEEAKNRLEELALKDGKTGLYNCTYSIQRLTEEIERVNRYGGCLSVMMIDIDYFKNYNDCCGHIKGDAALEAIGKLIRESIRLTDVAGRYGGEEFIVALPNTDHEDAYTLADRLRKAVEAYPFTGAVHQPGGKLTISIGISSYYGGTKAPLELIEEADQALYQVKQSGRNRVCLARISY